ncbi:hypothetical protein AB1E19_007946 [Capra hircus]
MSGGEVRRFPRRLFRRRQRQNWEEAVEAGGSPRAGRRLEAAHRVPARIYDLTGRQSRAASRVAWVGCERGARGPGTGPKGRSLPGEGGGAGTAAALARRLRGEGQFRAGPRLSRAAALPAQTQRPGGRGAWRNQVVWWVMPE